MPVTKCGPLKDYCQSKITKGILLDLSPRLTVYTRSHHGNTPTPQQLTDWFRYMKPIVCLVTRTMLMSSICSTTIRFMGSSWILSDWKTLNARLVCLQKLQGILLLGYIQHLVPKISEIFSTWMCGDQLWSGQLVTVSTP